MATFIRAVESNITKTTTYRYISENKDLGQISLADLEDYIDTDMEIDFNGEKIGINDYFGESICFAVRQRGHSF